MKKYLTLAAVLGLFAFAGVTFLAQAEEVAPAGTTMEKAAETPADADKAACEASAAAKKADGTDPTAEEKDAAVKKCLEEKAAAEKPADAPAEGAKE